MFPGVDARGPPLTTSLVNAPAPLAFEMEWRDTAVLIILGSGLSHLRTVWGAVRWPRFAPARGAWWPLLAFLGRLALARSAAHRFPFVSRQTNFAHQRSS